MHSSLLLKLSQRKSGWRPKAIINEQKDIVRNACMVSNGNMAKKVEVTGKNKREIDDNLEKAVIQLINELEQKDTEILQREMLVFSAIAKASIEQSYFFAPLVKQEAKQALNKYKHASEKLVDIIIKENKSAFGAQAEMVINGLNDATKRTFNKLSEAIINGQLPNFIQQIESMNFNPEKK